jgi:hypothetical protein
MVDTSNLPKGFMFMSRYEIVKALEKGSGGTVYLVRDHRALLNPEEDLETD